MYIFWFEKLQVWKEARILTVLIYQLIEKFPDKEKFGLTNQMRRASVWIGVNIAEGSSRFSSKEQADFYSISYKSLMELMSHSFTALDLKHLNDEVFEKTKSIVQQLSL